MKIFLSAVENAQCVGGGKLIVQKMIEQGIHMKWNLMSYYSIRARRRWVDAEYIRDHSDLIMIDSGAHSFQKGVLVDWDEYTEKYIDFIKEFDRGNVVGYFEMDVDNIIGYSKVLELRKRLESATDKIIPVWHKNRGISEYKRMCQEYAGRIVAVTGFKNEDIKDAQYLSFLKEAKKWGCKVHCLGMTRKGILDTVPFDFCDSSSWMQQSVFGRIANRGKVTREFSKVNRDAVFIENYKAAMQMQRHYYEKWRSVCKD